MDASGGPLAGKVERGRARVAQALWRREGELGPPLDLRRGDAAHLLLLIDAEVALQHADALLVDVVVRVLLQLLDLVEPLGLGHERRHGVVPACRHALLLSSLQDVLEALEGDGHDLDVVDREEVAERSDAPLLDEELDLLRRAAGRRVGDGPRRLLADVELGVRQELDEGRDWDEAGIVRPPRQRGALKTNTCGEKLTDVVVNHGLDLVLVPGRDVADGPARLLPDALLGARQQGQEAGQGVVVNDELRLEVVTRDDVPDRPERGRLHGRARVEEQLDEATAHARLDDRLDLLVGPVAQVGQGPARVRQDLLVGAEDELAQRLEGLLDQSEVRLGLPAAEVRERPSRVPQHTELGTLVELLQQGREGAGLQDQVAARRAVPGDVAQGPHGLLPHVVVGAQQEPDEDGHGAHLHDHLRVLARSAGDVGEGPRRLELQRGVVVPLQELDEAGHDARVDDLLYGRVLLDRQESAELRRALGLDRRVGAHDALDHLGGDSRACWP
ncbi:hypothetical protein THAOC_27715 [Thalassiosira oceanica]|uniref:Uncharacterized protein n=1 Tax=Thalassiosira oceanica TaxID=159749 RepID=K0RI76_THAOC|nr:hypothetical protein THAOC_27715 [Thalassiosira oceanica]|eukprot:EJK52945.1 hypothetical protein THAOC_27715 [Thalassiosira oceanica]